MVRLFSSIFLLFFCVSFTHADPAFDPIKELEKRVQLHTLKNGMKVILLKRSVAPLVSFQMLFKTGGVDEISGKTGLAHFFEHMLFKGSETVGTRNYKKEKPLMNQLNNTIEMLHQEQAKGEKADLQKIETLQKKQLQLQTQLDQLRIPAEFEEIYQRAGAIGLNAFTGQDITGFVVNLPSNKWELWPLLESDRMRFPVLREFYKERDVVMEERRMRYENSLRGKLWENFISAAYRAHPYGSPTIGWMSDLENLSLADAKDFFKTHYAPNNAVVGIIGDIDPKSVLKKLEMYFSKVPKQILSQPHISREPQQEAQREVTVYYDAQPSMIMGFHKPNPPHYEDIVMEMTAELLGAGRTSRFYRNIVEKKIALSAWASNGSPGERYPNLILFGGSPKQPYTNKDLERALLKEIQSLIQSGPTEKELQKIRNQLQARLIRSLSFNSGLARELTYYETLYGDWRYIFKRLEQIKKVTVKNIQDVAKKYFIDSNKTVAFLERKEK